MSRIDEIRNEQFNEEHKYLCGFLNQLERTCLKFLSEISFERHLVRKEVDYGLTFPSNKEHVVLFYKIEFTFFENIEDKFNGRENDVTIGIVVAYYPNNTFNLSRDIVSKYGDVDYSEEIGLTHISEELKMKIEEMNGAFLETMKVFIANSINERG